MTADDRDAIDRLDAYLDALAAGRPIPAEVNAEWQAVDRQFRSLDRAPTPRPVFAARLLEDLMPSHAVPRPPRLPSRPYANGRVSEPWLHAPRALPESRRRSAFGQLATAALVLLALVGGFVVFGPRGPGQEEESPAVLPAMSATPTTPETVTTQTLLDTPVEALPVGHVQVELDFWRLRPHPTPVQIPALDWPMVIVVATGKITATVAGVEQQLAAGEQLLVSGGHAVTFAAAGDGEASAYVVGLFTTEPQRELDPVAHTYEFLMFTSADNLPGGPGRIVLERLTLPPGSGLPPLEAQPWVWTEVGSGELGLSLAGDKLPFRWKSGAERTFRHGQYLPAVQPGTLMTFRNAGDDPLVLYRLRLMPSAGMASTAGSPAP